jgi:hypothetical protein
LQRRARIVEPDGDDSFAPFLYFEAQMEFGSWQNLDATEVDVWANRVRFALVERAGRSAIGWRRLRRLSSRGRIVTA